ADRCPKCGDTAIHQLPFKQVRSRFGTYPFVSHKFFNCAACNETWVVPRNQNWVQLCLLAAFVTAYGGIRLMWATSQQPRNFPSEYARFLFAGKWALGVCLVIIGFIFVVNCSRALAAHRS